MTSLASQALSRSPHTASDWKLGVGPGYETKVRDGDKKLGKGGNVEVDHSVGGGGCTGTARGMQEQSACKSSRIAREMKAQFSLLHRLSSLL